MPKRPGYQKSPHDRVRSHPDRAGSKFDFWDSRHAVALREEGINVVLVNSNPATIMTDPEMADEIYIEPLRADVIARIIEKEKRMASSRGWAGRRVLNLTVELA